MSGKMTNGCVVWVALALLLGCADQEPFGIVPAVFSGTYALDSVDGRALPVQVNTSWLQGTISSGNVAIDLDADYWLTLVTTTGRRISNGFVWGSEDGSLSFMDPWGEPRWEGSWDGSVVVSTVVLPDVHGTRFHFHRIGPYRRAQ